MTTTHTTIFPRMLEAPKRSFFLFGPRGSGKSTWLGQTLPNATRFDLLDEGRYQRYLRDITSFQRELEAVPRGQTVVIDEVQRLPQLLNEVHRAIEGRRLRFALTGSSARKIHRAGVNLLGGRATLRTMYPLSPEELGGDFDLERALRYGTLPLIWVADDPEEALEAYARLYLREEIQTEALVRNLPAFARFLPVAALMHGQTLNAAGLARDAGVARTTVNDYLSILEDTLVAVRLPAYEAKLRVRERAHPKLFWIDPGIVRALRRSHGAPVGDERGALLEGFVFMLLRLYRDTRRLCDDIYYWSPGEARATEVDFLLVRGSEAFAIEVKATTQVRDDHLRGLRAIAPLPGLVGRALVHLGRENGKSLDHIETLPFSAFAERLATGRLMP